LINSLQAENFLLIGLGNVIIRDLPNQPAGRLSSPWIRHKTASLRIVRTMTRGRAFIRTGRGISVEQ
jgi:hypothetical protein